MPIPGFTYTVIAASQVDADSPVDTDLMDAIRQDLEFTKEWLGGDFIAGANTNHIHDDIDSAAIAGASGGKVIAIGHAARSTGDYQGVNICNFIPDFVMNFPSDNPVVHTNDSNISIWSDGDNDGFSSKMGAGVGTNAHTNSGAQRNLGGYALPTAAAIGVNGNRRGALCLKNSPGLIKTGTYPGTGVVQSIVGLGFQPEFVLIWAGLGSTTNDRSPVVKTTGAGGNTSARVLDSAGTFLNSSGIFSFDADGFTVGTDLNVNDAALTFAYLAFKDGAAGGEKIQTLRHSVDVIGSYPQNLIGLNFIPEFVIVHNHINISSNRLFHVTSVPTQRDRVSRSFNGAGTRFEINFIEQLLEDGAILGTNYSSSGPATTLGTVWDFIFFKGGSNVAFST